jgi:hypothetical protein
VTHGGKIFVCGGKVCVTHRGKIFVTCTGTIFVCGGNICVTHRGTIFVTCTGKVFVCGGNVLRCGLSCDHRLERKCEAYAGSWRWL